MLAEAFMWRHHPQVARARELVAVGRGRRGCARSAPRSRSCSTRERDVRLQRELDGRRADGRRVLLRLAARGRSPAPSRSASRPSRSVGGDGVDVALAGVLRFPGDVLATIDCALTAGPRSELEAIGDEGSLVLDDPWHGWRAGHRAPPRGRAIERIEVPRRELLRARAARTSRRRCAASAPPLLDRDDAVGQARAIAALYASAESRSSDARWR